MAKRMISEIDSLIFNDKIQKMGQMTFEFSL